MRYLKNWSYGTSVIITTAAAAATAAPIFGPENCVRSGHYSPNLDNNLSRYINKISKTFALNKIHTFKNMTK